MPPISEASPRADDGQEELLHEGLRQQVQQRVPEAELRGDQQLENLLHQVSQQRQLLAGAARRLPAAESDEGSLGSRARGQPRSRPLPTVA